MQKQRPPSLIHKSLKDYTPSRYLRVKATVVCEDVFYSKQYSQYDKIFRENMRFTLPGIIEGVLKLEVVNSIEVVDKLQITKQKEVDAMRIVTDVNGEIYLLHIEFESGITPKMNFRMAEYRAMLHQLYDHPIKQYVIYLGEKKLTASNKIDLPGFKFEYDVISFSTLPYEMFLSADTPEAQILTVLANFGNADPTKLIQSLLAKLCKYNTEGLIKNKYLEQLRVIIQMRNLNTQLITAMESIQTFFKIERDAFFQLGEARGFEKGEAKGIAKGEERKNYELVKNLLLVKQFTPAEVARLVGVTDEFVKNVAFELESEK